MAERLCLIGKITESRNTEKTAFGFAVEHIIRLADAMDTAGFTQVADMLDGALRGMRKTALFEKAASPYEDFRREVAKVPMGDCRAIQGIYKRHMVMLESDQGATEGAMMKARKDCLAKCPSFRPEI